MKMNRFCGTAGKPRHFMERLLPRGLVVTADFAEAVEAEEDAP
jgi:hypothetical protein